VSGVGALIRAHHPCIAMARSRNQSWRSAIRDGLHLPTDAISNQGDASIEIVTRIRHVVLNGVEDPHHDFGMDQFGGVGCELLIGPPKR
jgi:hypothetical protein